MKLSAGGLEHVQAIKASLADIPLTPDLLGQLLGNQRTEINHLARLKMFLLIGHSFAATAEYQDHSGDAYESGMLHRFTPTKRTWRTIQPLPKVGCGHMAAKSPNFSDRRIYFLLQPVRFAAREALAHKEGRSTAWDERRSDGSSSC